MSKAEVREQVGFTPYMRFLDASAPTTAKNIIRDNIVLRTGCSETAAINTVADIIGELRLHGFEIQARKASETPNG